MKKANSLLFFAAIFTFVVSQWPVPEAHAVPAFSRQMGVSCTSCHFQHFPTLNAFGRAFKAGGYIQIGGQGKIEGEDLSIPDTLNASLVTKVRYIKTNGDNNDTGTNKGELQFPDEAALLIGGRAGEHVGFLLEAQMADDTAPMFASFKMPIVFDVSGTKLSVIPFTTDGGGASYGFELFNTGAMRMQRVLEQRSSISAQQFIGTATEAEGFAFVGANEMGFVNFTLWSPSHANAQAVGPLSKYLRIAATPQVGGWDLGIGAQYWGGTTGVGTVDSGTRAWAIDAQAQGNVGMPLGVYLSYANAQKSKAGEAANVFNTSTQKDKKAWSLLAELGVFPGKATVAAGYRAGDTGAAANNKDNVIILGATYLLAQNVEFQLNYEMFSGNKYDPKPANGDQRTTLMIFAAF